MKHKQIGNNSVKKLILSVLCLPIIKILTVSIMIDHLSLLLLATLLLCFGFYKSERWASLIGLGILGYEVVNILEVDNLNSLFHASIDLLLISFTIGLFLIIKPTFSKWGALVLGVLFSALLHKHPAFINFVEQSEDQEVELLVEFRNEDHLNQWIAEYSEDYDIVYPLFKVKDKSFKLDEYVGVNLTSAQSIDKVKQEIKSSDLVQFVEVNDPFTLPQPQELKGFNYKASRKNLDDPHLPKQWVSKRYDLNKIHGLIGNQSIQRKKNTIIAILDTGVESNHEDLKDNYISIAKEYDSDPRGHGTHCAGIAGAVSGNKIGIASLLPPNSKIKISSVKVLSSFGGGTQKSIIDGIIKASDFGADVISLSLGGPSSDQREKAYSEAVKYANSKGSIVVVAAGNSNKDAKNYTPANAKGVIAVTAIDSLGNRASFGNLVHNIEMAVAAPGTQIYSTVPKNDYKAYNGTSMSCPFVAGLLGIFKSFDPKITTAEAFDLLVKSSHKQDGLNIVDPQMALELFMQR